MEGKRIVIDPSHGHTRSRTFAILVLVGLVVVAAVWFLQLRTMIRQARLSEATADFAAIEEAMRAGFEASTGVASEAAVEIIPEGVAEAIAEGIAEERAKDAVAGEVTDAFTNAVTADATTDEIPKTTQEPQESVTE